MCQRCFIATKRENNANAMHYASDAVKVLFDDENFWDELVQMQQDTMDFEHLLLLFQNDGKKANIGDVVERLVALQEKYKNDANILVILDKFFKLVVTDLHYACVMLDWRKHGALWMTSDMREKGLNSIEKYLKTRLKKNDEKVFIEIKKILLDHDCKEGEFESFEFKNLSDDSNLLDVLKVYRAKTFANKNNYNGIFFAMAEDICRKRLCLFLFLSVLLSSLCLFSSVFLSCCVNKCFVLLYRSKQYNDRINI